MPIKWGQLFGAALEVGAAVTVAGMAIAAIDAQIDKYLQMSESNAVAAVAQSVAKMDDKTWSVWRGRFVYKAQTSKLGTLLLSVGDYMRQEMLRVGQMLQSYSIHDAIDISVNRLTQLGPLEQICFAQALAIWAGADMKAQAVMGGLVRLLNG